MKVLINLSKIFNGEISNKRKCVLTNFPDSIIDSAVGFRDPSTIKI